MHRNPKYVFLYRSQLSDALVLVFLFRHQCAAPFCLCHEGNFMMLRIYIRREAEQNISRIEISSKAICAFQENIHGREKDALYRDLFRGDFVI